MNVPFLHNEFIQAFCWTLIHSLWQGLLLAVIAGLAMIGMRRSSSAARYQALSFLFLSFLVLVSITFILEYQTAGNSIADNFAPTTITKTDVVLAAGNLLEQFKDYFNANAWLVVLGWFVVFTFRFIRLTTHLVYTQRLKHYKTYAPPKVWGERLGSMTELLGIHKTVKLMESGIVKIPVVIGVLKPVILMPLGLMVHLPPDEVEAILLHELAHIKRKDYFMNLGQCFAETIFFFNPALLWLSALIREERENCCDDLAISVTSNKENFVRALIAFEEYNISASSFQLAFPGRKNLLVERVKRIVYNRNKTLNTAEKSVLGLCMGLLVLFSFVTAQKISATISAKTITQNKFIQQPIKKSIPKKNIKASSATSKKTKETVQRIRPQQNNADSAVQKDIRDLQLNQKQLQEEYNARARRQEADQRGQQMMQRQQQKQLDHQLQQLKDLRELQPLKNIPDSNARNSIQLLKNIPPG